MDSRTQIYKEMLEFLHPTLEKISLSFFLLFAVLIGLLLNIPEWIYLPLMTVLAWPLLGMAQLCGPSDLECQSGMSFLGLMMSLAYWYLAACFFSWALERQEEDEE